LVVLNEEGVYRVYDLQGDYNQYTLGGEATELGVIDAHIFDNGLVAMIGNLTILEVKGWEGGKPLTLANPGTSIHLYHIERAKYGLHRSSRAP
jgi:vacuolar protein sorting-associated protein 16